MNVEAIKTAVAKFSFTADGSADQVIVKNKKGQIAAVVTAAGVEQKKQGQQNLCGALVRDAIKAAMYCNAQTAGPNGSKTSQRLVNPAAAKNAR